MTRMARFIAGISALCIVHSAAARGGDAVLPVGPFEGDASEGFESFPAGFYSELEIFFTEPTLDLAGEANGLIVPAFITTFSSFMGSTIQGHESAQFSHMTGPVEFVFFSPIRQFGGYIATNSGANGGIVEFFDDKDTLIATTPLDVTFQLGIAPYTWNGWVSELPFSRVRISSNGALKGFLGFDDMQMSFVPGPGGVVLFAVAGMSGVRPRRRRA